jgi:hypothetical protein
MTAEQHNLCNLLCRLRARLEHAVALRLESSSRRLGKVEGRRQMFGLHQTVIRHFSRLGANLNGLY